MGTEEKFVLRTQPENHNTQFIEAMATYRFVRNLTEGKRVLDAGCAFGYGSYVLAQNALNVTGVDFDEKTLLTARKDYSKDNLSYVLSDLTRLAFIDECFEVACLFEVLSIVPQYRKLLGEMHRVLKRGGALLLSTRNKISDIPITNNGWHTAFSPDELKALLKESGFRIRKLHSLSRPEEVYLLEAKLKKLRKLDLLHMARYIPRPLISMGVHLVSKCAGITPPRLLKDEDFVTSAGYVECAPGILVICEKI